MYHVQQVWNGYTHASVYIYIFKKFISNWLRKNNFGNKTALIESSKEEGGRKQCKKVDLALKLKKKINKF